MIYEGLDKKDLKRTLLTDLNKYVKHSDNVWKHSTVSGLKTAEKLEEIEKVICFIDELNKFSSTYNICLKIFQLKKRLYKILPHPNNNSYENQYNRITELIDFSTNYIKPKVKPTKQLITV